MTIALPKQAAQLLSALQKAGFSAFVVGGCVRDCLLGREPVDWDLCTSAQPAQIKALFARDSLLLTGEKHGTVGVVRDGHLFEITTYRLDGAYSDNRRPDSVTYVSDIHQDLARRDFTINAMAWAPNLGLIDDFGGLSDLKSGVIRCVGDANARFQEDALRMLRALRFAAQLNFAIDPDTAAAGVGQRGRLQHISAERLFTEIDKLLSAPAAGRILAQYAEVLAGALPEILPCLGEGRDAMDTGAVWRQTAAAVGNAAGGSQPELPAQQRRCVLWALLLHDLAKPLCDPVTVNGSVQYPDHPARGAKLAAAVLGRLKAPGELRRAVPPLVAAHNQELPAQDSQVLSHLNRYGPEFLHELCAIQYADRAAGADRTDKARTDEIEVFSSLLEKLEQNGCYRVSQLQVNGEDVLAAGIPPGPAVGEVLQALLRRVMSGSLPNERAALLAALASGEL